MLYAAYVSTLFITREFIGICEGKRVSKNIEK